MSAEPVRVTHGVRIAAEPLYPRGGVSLDVDGERLGALPVHAVVKPRAVVFRA